MQLVCRMDPFCVTSKKKFKQLVLSMTYTNVKKKTDKMLTEFVELSVVFKK